MSAQRPKKYQYIRQQGFGQGLQFDEDTASESKQLTPWLDRFKWKPGQTGNPGGRALDLSCRIARAVFRSNPEGIRRAMVRQLLAGSVRAYEVLSNRAFGLLPRPIDIRMAATVVNIPAELVEMVNELDDK